MAKTAVVALGGNALTREGQAGTYAELQANATQMARSVCSLLRTGWRVVLVHGNGPQVGNLAIQQEEGARPGAGPAPVLPGGDDRGPAGQPHLPGPAASRASRSGCGGRWRSSPTCRCSPTTPPSTTRPSPSAPSSPRRRRRRWAAARGWVVKPDAGRGFRRVVPSPQPVTILETPAIRALLEAGQVVVAAGGGGVPGGALGDRLPGRRRGDRQGLRRPAAGHRPWPPTRWCWSRASSRCCCTTARPSRCPSTR